MPNKLSTMEILLIVIGVFLIFAGKYFIIKFIFNKNRISNLSEEELYFDDIRDIYKALLTNKNINTSKIIKYTNDITKRTLIFEILLKYNMLDEFPKQFLTIEKASESYLSNWLYFNDKFDCHPDKLIIYKEIILNNNTKILVYKFKVFLPHILYDKGWMYAYVGYKNINEYTLYNKPTFIKSNFDSFEIDENILNKL